VTSRLAVLPASFPRLTKWSTKPGARSEPERRPKAGKFDETLRRDHRLAVARTHGAQFSHDRIQIAQSQKTGSPGVIVPKQNFRA